MAKFHGFIGFVKSVESKPGVWSQQTYERGEYYGDFVKRTVINATSETLNDSINIANDISIVADAYINDNLRYIRYVEFMGTKWKIKNFDIKYPRLILTMGGVYNGK